MMDIAVGLPIPDRMAPAYAYWSAAAALGYDQAEGFAFRFLYAGTPLKAADALAQGRCRFAPLNVTVGFLAHARGQALCAVYSSSRRAHRWFAVPPDSPIRVLSDLAGKRVTCDFADLWPLAESALTEEGVDHRTLVRVPWQGSGMAVREMVGPFRRGEVDAVFVIDWNHGDFIAEGLPMRRLPSKLMDRAETSSCLWTMADQADDPIVGRVGRALAKATLFALLNPEAVIRLMWKSHSDTRPTPDERDRELRRGIEILKARTDTMRPEGARDPRWGVILADEMAEAADHLARANAIPACPDSAVLFNQTHLAAFNAFDPGSVEEDARAA
ncbi:MAG: ABC transporter substrate-binding protein [Alphaproteobacteria bacterium]